MGLKTEAKRSPPGQGRLRPRLRRRRRQRRRGAAGSPASIGYPVLIKAAAGGGGKGMRRLPRRRQPRRARSRRRSTRPRPPSRTPSVYLEKYIDRPRHVEVQILADSHGNVVHCWDRDCSLQRRHQKLVEEVARPDPAARGAAGSWARPPSARQGRRLRQRRHLRVPRRRRQQLLLHRGQRPHPGRAPGHRDGHRHRPGQAADPDRRRRAAAVHAGGDRHPSATRSSAGSTPRTRPRLPPLARHDHRAPDVPGGPGVRWDSHVQVGYTVPPELRLAGGQADRPRPDPPRGDRHDAPRPRRAGDRGDPDDDPAPSPRSSATPRLHRRAGSIPPGSSAVLMPQARELTGECRPNEPSRLGRNRPARISLWPARPARDRRSVTHGRIPGCGIAASGLSAEPSLSRSIAAAAHALDISMKVGLLTGGGDCPGLNAVIRAVVQRITTTGAPASASCEGWRGLVRNLTVAPRRRADRRHHRAGRHHPRLVAHQPVQEPRDRPARGPRRTSRPRPRRPGRHRRRRHPGRRRPPLQRLRTADRRRPQDDRQRPDLVTDFTFGFDTAINIVTEAVDRLRTTDREPPPRSWSSRRWDGTPAGSPASRASPSPPTTSSSPKCPSTCPTCIGVLTRRRAAARTTASSSSPKGHEFPDRGAVTLDQTPTRSVTSASAASATSSPTIEKQTGIETRCVVLGHLQRGGPPTAYDRVLATRLGLAASHLVIQERFGTVVTLKGDRIVETALARRPSGTRTLDLALLRRGRSLLQMMHIASNAIFPSARNANMPELS